MKGKNDDFEDYSRSTTYVPSTPEIDECAVNYIDQLKKILPGLKNTTLGDILEIRLEGINVLTVYNDLGQPCGNIASYNNGKIVNCIRKHRKFYAKLLSNGGQIQVYSA